MKLWKGALAGFVLVLIGAYAFVSLGVFNVSADEPHSRPVFWLAEAVRDASIAARAKDVEVPKLDDPEMILAGGADYNEMCTGCHMKPGMKHSEMNLGLYPKPPNLTQAPADRGQPEQAANPERAAARQFWVIKHGMKMTGMPAWGATHDDARIWAMVAFLQKLPTLSEDQYQILTARGEGDEPAHEHGEAMEMSGMAETKGSAGQPHEAEEGMASMPGMAGRPGMEGMSHDAGSKQTPESVIDAFHAALKSGDMQRATALLLPELLVYEGGSAERSRGEYVKAHMKEDMAFMQAAEVTTLKSAVQELGDAAWVTSETRVKGTSDGKPYDVLSTETAVLKRTGSGWRIAHLHWSSQRATSK